MKSLLSQLQEIHSALDDALGDSDIDYMSMRQLREERPVQWAAYKLALVMAALEENRKRSQQSNNRPSTKRG